MRFTFVVAASTATLLFGAVALPKEDASAEELPPLVVPGQEQEKAQTPPPSELPEPEVAAGQVVLLLFAPNGAAVADVTVTADTGLSAVTSAEGVVRLTLPVGQRTLTLTFPPPAEGPPPQRPVVNTQILITEGVTSEVIGNVQPGGDVRFDVEGPGAESNESTPEPAEEEVVLGRIDGIVVASETQEPLEGAKVFVRGVDVEGVTGVDGKFSLTVPVGIHGVSAIRDRFSTQTVNDIDVAAEPPAEVRIEMSPASAQLEDYIVTAPYIEGSVSAVATERRESSSVAEVIGAEQMAQSGDSSAASALKRVTGLSVVGGKFVYVRGMGERYSSTLLNGLNLPSPEPERRVVPLDLFPAGMLESVTVQKTYSPDMPGEFGGGSVQLRSKSFPDEFTLGVSLSAGGNTQSTLQEGLTYRGGSTDWLGFDDGGRELPSVVASSGRLKRKTRFEEGLTPEEFEVLGDSFDPNYRIYNRTVPVDHSLGVTVGNTFDIGFPLGVMASLSYDRKFRLREGVTRTASIDTSVGELKVENDYAVKEDQVEINTGALFVLGVEPLPHQQLEATTVVLRMSDDRAFSAEGPNGSLGRSVRNYQLRWVERQLFSQQLIGTHPFTLDPDQDEFDLEPLLNWRLGYSNAERLEPDRRTYRYDLEPSLGEYRFRNDTGTSERFFSDLEDDMYEAGLDLSWPISLASDDTSKLVPKVGALVLTRQREVGGRAFSFGSSGGPRVSPGFATQELDEVLSRDNIHPEGHELGEETLSDPAGKGSFTYRARQSVVAGYAQGTLTLLSDFDLMAGARFEKLVQVTTSFDQFADPEDPQEGDELEARIDDFDILPAVTGTWRISEGLQVRAGFGVTVSRPDFREKSTSRYFDVEDSNVLTGNPDLTSALIRNYDARFEWYPSPDESFSIGGFFKDFKRPIELVNQAAAGSQLSWINSKGAQNFGLEIEGRKRLGFLSDSLQDLYVASNLSLIQSSVTIDKEIKVRGVEVVPTSSERPLQGQSPYVINFQLGYDDVTEGRGTTASLLYNVFGPRIDSVGGQGLPDAIEEPHHQLDLVFGHKFSEHFSTSFKAKNLINGRKRTTLSSDTETFTKTARRDGRDFSLGAKWTY